MKYNKSAMVNDLSAATGTSRADVGKILSALFDSIKEKTAEGVVVNLAGLGRFEQKTRKARMGRNPQTGEPIEIPEAQYLHFKAEKAKS
jgi:nucleoid DNA-binding protein